MLSLVGDSAGERVVEILGEELTGSLIENRGGDLREEDELLQLRMDEWKVAVNPQVQSAAEARPLGGLEWCPEWRFQVLCESVSSPQFSAYELRRATEGRVMISDNESKYVLLSNEAARTDEEVRGDAAEEGIVVVENGDCDNCDKYIFGRTAKCGMPLRDEA